MSARRFSAWVAAATAFLGLPALGRAESVTSRDEAALGARSPLEAAASLRPQLGLVTVEGGDLGDSTRLAAGVGLNADLMPHLGSRRGGAFRAELASGARYSYLGRFGGGTHLLMVPANLQLGRSVAGSGRLSVHGGATFVYASSPAVLGAGARWSARPNVGLDLEWELSRSAAILIRPDWAFAERGIFMATVGLSFPAS
jgi:hypothetical protein